MNTLEKVRKPVHNRCFGIEIEGIFNHGQVYSGKYYGFFYCGSDGSIQIPWRDNKIGAEMVSQPLPYSMLQKQIGFLEKKVGKWTVNDSCGIHVHVSKTAVSLSHMEKLWKAMCGMTEPQIEDLFGRVSNNYCHRTERLFSLERYCAINTRPAHTYEFRMFSSGDAAWAKECLRRTKIMCEIKGKISYETLLEAFTNPDKCTSKPEVLA